MNVCIECKYIESLKDGPMSKDHRYCCGLIKKIYGGKRVVDPDTTDIKCPLQYIKLETNNE